jgi:hypothetical protein
VPVPPVTRMGGVIVSSLSHPVSLSGHLHDPGRGKM